MRCDYYTGIIPGCGTHLGKSHRDAWSFPVRYDSFFAGIHVMMHNYRKIAMSAFLRDLEGCGLTQQRGSVPDPHISQRMVVSSMRMTQSPLGDRFRLARHVRKPESPQGCLRHDMDNIHLLQR
jgi:hypothetical protein